MMRAMPLNDVTGWPQQTGDEINRSYITASPAIADLVFGVDYTSFDPFTSGSTFDNSMEVLHHEASSTGRCAG